VIVTAIQLQPSTERTSEAGYWRACARITGPGRGPVRICNHSFWRKDRQMNKFWHSYWNGIRVAACFFGALLIVFGAKEYWGNGSDLIAGGMLIFLVSWPSLWRAAITVKISPLDVEASSSRADRDSLR
jgi:hypothetical protein